MLAWTQQNTMQGAMRTVLEWPQSHTISKTINMLTNKSEPQQKCRLGTVSKNLLGGLNRFYGRPTSPSASIMANLHIKVIRIICIGLDFSCVQAPKMFHLASTWFGKISHFVPSLPMFELDEKLHVLNVFVYKMALAQMPNIAS